MSNYSVLMTVYEKDNPEYVRLSINSMLNQTIKTNDFVLVCDGPLTLELDDLLDNFVSDNPNLFNVIKLKENVGLGQALNIGLKECKNEYVARMDDDDISMPNRCEKQIELLEKQSCLSIVGSYMDEFENDFTKPLRTKRVPENFVDIKKYCRRRNPFNHSTVLLRKSDVIAAGNYSNMRTNQDVELWTRMLNQGYIGCNIPESLVLFRFDQNTYERRKKWSNVKLMIETWKNFRKKKYCSRFDYFVVYWSQIAIFVMPKKILKLLYGWSRKGKNKQKSN